MVPKVKEGRDRCPVQEGASFCEGRDAHGRLAAVQPTVQIRTNSRDDEKRRKWTNETRQAFHVAPSVSDGRARCSEHEDTSLAEDVTTLSVGGSKRPPRIRNTMERHYFASE